MVYWSSQDLKQIAIVGMILVTIIELAALAMGYNGVLLTSVVGGFTAFLGVIGKTIHDIKKSGGP